MCSNVDVCVPPWKIVCLGGVCVGPIEYETIAPIVTAVTKTVTVSNIVSVLAAVVTAAIAFVFMWWGVRKIISIIMAAFRKGKLSV